MIGDLEKRDAIKFETYSTAPKVSKLCNILNRDEGKVNILRHLIELIIILMISNLSIGIFRFWNNTIRKILAIKEINVAFFALCVQMTTTEVLPLCSLVESYCTNKITFYHNENSQKQQQIRKERIGKLKRLEDFNIKFFMVLMGFSVFMPWLQSVYVILIHNNYDDIQEIPFVLFSYYPEKYKSVTLHAIVQTGYGVFLIINELQMYCIFTAMYMASQTLTDEFDLLVTCLEEIDDNIRDYDLVVKNVKDNVNVVKYHRSSYENKLQTFLSKLVDHHSSLYSNVEVMNRRISSLCFATINAFTFQLFTCVMCAIEIENFATRIKYVFFIIFIAFLMILCASIGQNISDKGEEVRNALCNCSWVDKPEWFKKSILIMLIRSSKPLVIMPFGLYVLDLKRFAVILNGIYSYFNVIY
ncbi:uncharacterized protein LOC111056460 [Nilaparvata lugens]|uniref:uncharacterized protein LOC111056460 n=1 Tax=Nilaparvata lugens TaxID=108931 RepID=UPI00193CD978|nr:uncharacterized protein LOC111056460 [Nilaparvata lugens]